MSGHAEPRVIRFGVFEVDLQTGELRKHGARVKLRDQSFRVLALLLARSGELVSREDLRRELWPGHTFVDFDLGLNKAVSRLRDALGEVADKPVFIETLPKRGYRFIGSITDAPGAAADPAAAQSASAEPAPQPAPAAHPEPPASGPFVLLHGRGRWWLAGAAVVLVAAAGTAVIDLRRAPALTERDRVVLANFDNRTGDTAFDIPLAQALVLNLEQSPFLKIVSDREVAATLQLMQVAADQPVTAARARDVCQRTAAKAVLEGSLVLLGSEYVIGLSAANCWSGETLAREQVRAARKEDVLEGLDSAAANLRAKLGESLASIQKFDRRVHDVLTTSSLEAFRAYSNGEQMVLSGRSGAAFFKRAIELDPDFAYANAAIGLVYGTMGEAALSTKTTLRAYELRDHVSEWERYFITAQYHFRVTGEIEKVLQVCEMWVHSYPRDRTAHNRLAYAYRQLGQYENAVMEYLQAQQLGGDHAVDLRLLARTYIDLDRFDEARAVLRKASAMAPDSPGLRQLDYVLSFLEGRLPPETDGALVRGSDSAESLLLRADTEAYFGRLGNARELTRAATEVARRSEYDGRATLSLANDALREALFGNAEAARRQADATFDRSPGWDARVLAALALARAGDATRAATLADQLNAELPVSTLVQRYWLPTIRAEIALVHEDPVEAVALLEAALDYELADTSSSGAPALYPAYVRGSAYLRADNGAAAAAEFQKILEHRGLTGINPIGALARLGLARAHVLSGDTVKAKTEYQQFIAFWKNADGESPVLEQATMEYRSLR